jgi:hypothetical protein
LVSSTSHSRTWSKCTDAIELPLELFLTFFLSFCSHVLTGSSAASDALFKLSLGTLEEVLLNATSQFPDEVSLSWPYSGAVTDACPILKSIAITMQARRNSLHVFAHPANSPLSQRGVPTGLKEMTLVFKDHRGKSLSTDADVDESQQKVVRNFTSGVDYSIIWAEDDAAETSYKTAARVRESYNSLFLPSGLSQAEETLALENHLRTASAEEEANAPKEHDPEEKEFRPIPGVKYVKPSNQVMALREVARKGAALAAAQTTRSPPGPPVVLRELSEARMPEAKVGDGR